MILLYVEIWRNHFFKNQQKFELNLGENEEQFDLNDEINYLNLI